MHKDIPPVERPIKRIEDVLPNLRERLKSNPDVIIEELAITLYTAVRGRRFDVWATLSEGERFYFRTLAETAYQKLWVTLSRGDGK